MKIVLVAVLMAQSIPTPPKGVMWHQVDPFCGRFQSLETKVFPLESANIKLYRAKEKHLPCCESVATLGDVKIDKGGNFDLRKLPAGEYWLVLSWNWGRVSVPVWPTKKYSYACDQNFYSLIELSPSAEKFEITMHMSVN